MKTALFKEKKYHFENGSILTGLELCLLDSIISENNGVYYHDMESGEIREALDMLVLTGAIEREKCKTGKWKNSWRAIPDQVDTWKNIFYLVSYFIPAAADA